MPKPNPKPVERPPHGVTLPFGWHAIQGNGIPYRPRDKPVQEDWKSIARKFQVGVEQLIYFNFMTVEPDEVNWYLHHHTGCNKVSPSGNNWMFSNTARPGIIYIPPAEHDPIDVDPEQVCVWMPKDVKKFMWRLVAISKGMSGNRGQRIKKLVQVILRAGYPGCNNLWYYNDLAVLMYVQFHTGNAERREMTKATLGAFPFDGDSGTHGNWQIHPVVDLLAEFACGYSDTAALKHRLEWIDDEMYKGWYQMSLVDAQSSQGGGSAFGPLVWDFINHVRLLSEDNTHLYSAFGS